MGLAIIIPTYNGGDIWKACAKNINKYKSKNTPVYVIDSQSSDDTVSIAKKYNFNVKVIDKNNFNHGGTRNEAINDLPDNIDIAILITQDAIPQEGFCENILDFFGTNNQLACVYGRQLPHDDANHLAIHARLFNYKDKNYISSWDCKDKLGIKAVFTSNSFCAYKVDLFKKIGGFPRNTILSEDMYFAAKAISNNYQIGYAANAKVKHSHNYSVLEEFKRYFDIGVFHAQEPWIRERFGGAGGEGKLFIISELKYLIEKRPFSIISAGLHNLGKIFGYKLGMKYKLLPKLIIKNLSMHSRYWRD